ncbi:MAG TPA: MMPL family transporter [Solirubrobacterales bacterium]|nr:MMPL family transporter [Solirubrobacterales bacterium]
MFDALARIANGRARRVGLIAIVFFVVAAAVGGSVSQHMGPYGAEDGRSESVKADKALEAAGYRDFDVAILVEDLDLPKEGRPGTAQQSANAREVQKIRNQVAVQPGVRRAISYDSSFGANPALISKNGDSTLILASLDSTDDKEQQETAAALADELSDRDNVLVGGVALANEQVNKQVEKDLQRAELMVFPLLFLFSLLFFRSLVAAILPLMVGAIAIVGTFLALRIATEIGSVSFFALNLTTGLGLGLAIDYSLFIVSRYREEIAQTGPGLAAMKRTMNTAGRTVLFSSLTVAASMAALLIFPQRFLYSMGLGGVLVALLSAIVALTVLPAVLTLLGSRVNSLAPKFLQRRQADEAVSGQSGFWYRLSRFVMKRPGPIAAITALGLILLALPAFGMKFVAVDADILPPGTSSRVVQEAQVSDFPDSNAETIRIAVRGTPEAARETERRVAGIEEIAAVKPIRLTQDLYLIEATARGGYMDDATKRAVDEIRAAPSPPGGQIQVSGGTALFKDFQESLLDHLPYAFAIIVGATLLILFLMTGSVVLPVKSLLMNVLNLGAVFGLLTLIFQDGNLSWLLDFEPPGGIDQSTPILILAITFGLSTDYAVFLLSRIKEARDSGISDSESVAVGLERTGRIVTAAALLFAIAVGAFAAGEIVFVKELGVGTALAVLIDATIIRALLVPSLMELLGRRNWWAPGPLRRFHDRWGLSESAGDPTPQPATQKATT